CLDDRLSTRGCFSEVPFGNTPFSPAGRHRQARLYVRHSAGMRTILQHGLTPCLIARRRRRDRAEGLSVGTAQAFAFAAFFAACKRSFLIRRAFRFLTLSVQIGI